MKKLILLTLLATMALADATSKIHLPFNQFERNFRLNKRETNKYPSRSGIRVYNTSSLGQQNMIVHWSGSMVRYITFRRAPHMSLVKQTQSIMRMFSINGVLIGAGVKNQCIAGYKQGNNFVAKAKVSYNPSNGIITITPIR